METIMTGSFGRMENFNWQFRSYMCIINTLLTSSQIRSNSLLDYCSVALTLKFMMYHAWMWIELLWSSTSPFHSFIHFLQCVNYWKSRDEFWMMSRWNDELIFQQREWHWTGWRTPCAIHLLMHSGPLFPSVGRSCRRGPRGGGRGGVMDKWCLYPVFCDGLVTEPISILRPSWVSEGPSSSFLPFSCDIDRLDIWDDDGSSRSIVPKPWASNRLSTFWSVMTPVGINPASNLGSLWRSGWSWGISLGDSSWMRTSFISSSRFCFSLFVIILRAFWLFSSPKSVSGLADRRWWSFGNNRTEASGATILGSLSDVSMKLETAGAGIGYRYGEW